MQLVEHIALPKLNRAVTHGVPMQLGSERTFETALPKIEHARALHLAAYLHEDLAQTLCAVKVRLEGLAQDELRDAHLALSIGALQSAICQLSSIAAELAPTTSSGVRSADRNFRSMP